MEEVDERAFLLGEEGGADVHHLVGGVVRVDEDLLDVLRRLKGSGHPLCIGRSFSDVLPDGCELLGSEGCRSELAALDLALVGPLERSAGGDDPAWAQHLELEVGIVRDGHELCVTRSPQNGMVDRGEPDYLEGEGLCPIVGRILEADRQVDLPDRYGLLSWHNAVERCLGRPDARSIDALGNTCLCVHDVEAAAPVH